MNPLLTVAVKAARRAGRTILRHIDRLERIAVEQKGRNDFVSEVDRMAEDDIVGLIQSRYPNHRIVAEERGGELAPAPGREEVEWIIDPLDGTTNYLHAHPHFAVSIAARHNGEVRHAVIFDPLRDEMYTASRGQGAQLNSRRIRVTGQRRLEHCLLATGLHYRGAAQFERWLRCFKALIPRVIDVRRCGSAALDLAYVACGRFDGYWQSGLAPWDIAAGCLLVREAGGLVADFQGMQNFLETGQVIAANRVIFNDLMVIIAAETDPDKRREAPRA